MPSRSAAALAVLAALSPARAAVDPADTHPATLPDIPARYREEAGFTIKLMETDGSRAELTCSAYRDMRIDNIEGSGDYRLHIATPHGLRYTLMSSGGWKTYVRGGKGREMDLAGYAGQAVRELCAPSAATCPLRLPARADVQDFILKDSIAERICADEIDRRRGPLRPGTDEAPRATAAPPSAAPR